MTNQNEKPQSILEALGVRGREELSETLPIIVDSPVIPIISKITLPKEEGWMEEIYPEQTQDEIIAQALHEATVETQMMNLDEPPQILPNLPMTTLNPPEMKIPIIPVSNIVSQPVTVPSIPEYPPQSLPGEQINPKNNDVNLRRIKEYVTGNEFSVNWVRLHLTNLGRIPNVVPVMTIWDISSSWDIPKIIYDIIQEPGYIDNIWPCLRIIMGSSQDNIMWTVGVMTTIALFDCIRTLPFLEK